MTGLIGSARWSAAAGGTPTSRERGAPERLEADFMGAVQTAARAPGHALERPLAVANTAARFLTGTPQDQKGPLDSILQGIGDLGFGEANVGNLVGAVGQGIMHVGNIPQAVINSQDAELLARLGDAPDSTILNEQTLGRPISKRIDGPPILGFFGLGGRDMTYGEYKAELSRRGFDRSVDMATGESTELSWEQVIEKARRDPLGFGMSAINDSLFVEMAGRVALDPFNILLGAGVLGKAGRLASWATNPAVRPGFALATAAGSKLRPLWGVGYTADMASAGIRLAQKPSAMISARAIQAGRMESATLKGLGMVLAAPRTLLLPGTGSIARRYARGALRTELGLLGAETVAGIADAGVTNVLGEDNIISSGFLEPLHDAAQTFLADKPMSEDITFMLVSAFAMPVVPILKADIGAVRGAARRSFGDQDLYLWGRDFGVDTSGVKGRQDPLGRRRGKAREAELVARLGGLKEFARLIDHVDMRVAWDRLKSYSPMIRHLESFDEAMARSKAIGHVVATEAARLRDSGQISAELRLEAFKGWGRAHSRTLVDRKGNLLREVPQRVDFELSPAALIEQWKIYRKANTELAARFQPIGEAILGRASRLTKEDLRFLRAAVVAASKKGRVESSYVRDLLSQAPAMFEDTTLSPAQHEFWLRLMNLGVAGMDNTSGGISLAELDAQLNVLIDKAPPARELYHEAAKSERKAPADPSRTTGGIVRNGKLRKIYSVKELRRLRVESNGEVRSLTKEIAAGRLAMERKWTNNGNLRAQGRMVEPRGKVSTTAEKAAWATERAAEQAEITAKVERARTLRREVREINERAAEITTTRIDPSFLDENGNPTVTPESLEALREQTAYVQDEFPLNYGVEKAPKVSYARYEPDDSHLAALLTERSNLAQVLFDYGPIAKMTQFLGWVTSPVKAAKMAHDGRQQVYHLLQPLGAKSEEVTAFLNALRNEQSKGFTIGKMHVPFFRGITATLPNRINEIVRNETPLGKNEAFVRAFKQKYGGLDRMHVLLDEAHNSLIRKIDQKVMRGEENGKLSRIFRSGYWAWQNLPGLRGASDTTRMISKVFYPLFRFQMDLRWHALNIIEADTIAFFRDGVDGTRFSSRRDNIVRRGGKDVNLTQNAVDYHGDLSGMPMVGSKGNPGRDAAYEDTGIFLTNQNLALPLKRSFQKQSLENVDATLDDLAATDPMLQLLQRKYGVEKKKWSGQLNETMYSFDRYGVRQTIDEAVRGIRKYEKWTQAEYDQMVPFINKLMERNQQTFDDLVQIHVGNINRSRLERTMNSFWLYWPISYQIKATKWMVGALTQRSFGQQTNLGGAWTLDRAADRVRELVNTSPEFAQQMEDNEDWWFAASMLLPMAPWDVGTSLNRHVRYVGGNVLGLWPEYQGLDDPGDYAQKIFEMGPMYTVELWDRLISPFFKKAPDEGATPTSFAP